MLQKNRPLQIFTLLTVYLMASGWAAATAEEVRFHSQDGSFSLGVASEFFRTVNPYAQLSLHSPHRRAIVATKGMAERSLDEAYASTPGGLPTGQYCLGRSAITVGDEQSILFLIEGMYPPGGPASHLTTLAIVVRDGQEYNFMIHSPVEDPVEALEEAYPILQSVQWAKPHPKQPVPPRS